MIVDMRSEDRHAVIYTTLKQPYMHYHSGMSTSFLRAPFVLICLCCSFSNQNISLPVKKKAFF